jgi:hypothetical protein
VCSSNAECVKPAVCRNGVCQTVAVEAEADAVKPNPLVCEDQARDDSPQTVPFRLQDT